MRNSSLAYKIVASIFILVVAGFLATNVSGLLALLALLVIFVWI